MTVWLVDTLVWTAALIVLVLVVRRPVTRWFGPQIAYTLWALPFLRLILPPITLPSWLAPETQPHAQAVTLEEAAMSFPAQSGGGTVMLAPAHEPSGLIGSLASLWESAPVFEIAGGIWLIGAVIFLYRRFDSYFALRDELLADGREVGRAGKVRFVETTRTQAPLAFGVIDPVIAMPEGFMAHPDRTARDLALAHELAHHKGRDLIVNIAVQPLFALHWWNPLCRYGWLALRRDQEAACDARVVAEKPAEERAAYAGLIASFAAGPNVALAAPMACPVLGDKSIIHRLRSLNMSDTSKSRRIAGRLMLGAGVLALPLTASITYAESIAPKSPVTATPPAVSVAPPAPLAPVAPLAVQAMTEVDPDTEVEVEVETQGSPNVFVVADENVWVEKGEDGEEKRKVRKVIVKNKDGLSTEDREKMLEELRMELAEAEIDIEEAMEDMQIAMIDLEGAEGRTVIRMNCKGDKVANEEVDAKGNRVVHLCQSKVMASALEGLKKARTQIAGDTEMSDEMRSEVLRELDDQIKRWNEKGKAK